MGRRILLVTRRFWPLATPGDAELLALVDAWRGQGAEVSVVTPQWDRSWPTQLVVREMHVTRLPFAPKRLWSGYWYLRRLHQWLRRAAREFDFIVVSRMQLDLLVAIRVGQEHKIPVIVLYEGSGAQGDAAWIHHSSHAAKIIEACRRAAAVMTFDEQSHAEAIGTGVPREICHLLSGVIPAEISSVLPRSVPPDRRRAAARIHLLESNRDLFTTPSTPVGLTIATLEERAPLHLLFQAWSELREDHHDARLWWIGDGVQRSALYAILGDYDLRYHAVLPGDFDDVQELLEAANFYVAPSLRAAVMIRRALAAGAPVIAADLPEITAMIPAAAPVRYYRASDPRELARALREMCDAPQMTSRRGGASRDWATGQTQADEAAKQHLQLFDQLREDTP